MSASSLSASYRTAFVTGASSGLGKVFVEMLLAEGVSVWGTARELSRLSAFASVEGFHPVVLDLHKPAEALTAFEKAELEAGGGFDLVVQNAGYGQFGSFVSQAPEHWEALIGGMLLCTARLSRAALRGMERRGGGCLVHVASLATELPIPFMSGYNVAKAGLSALSESLFMEYSGTKIRVLDFRPGDYRTAFNQAMGALPAGCSERERRVWREIERNMEQAPTTVKAAKDLRRALLRRSSGIVRSGSFFQARVAPLLAALVPASLFRWGKGVFFHCN